MNETRQLYNKEAAAEYCGFTDQDSKDYFWSLHKEGRGPSFLKPSDRKVFFTKAGLDRWMQTWQAIER
jgi:hypothetical protein